MAVDEPQPTASAVAPGPVTNADLPAPDVALLRTAAEGPRPDVRLLARAWSVVRRPGLEPRDRAAAEETWHRLLERFEEANGPIEASWFASVSEQAVLITRPERPDQAALHVALDRTAPGAALEAQFVALEAEWRAVEGHLQERPLISQALYGLLVRLCVTLDGPPVRDVTLDERLSTISAELERVRARVDRSRQHALGARLLKVAGAAGLGWVLLAGGAAIALVSAGESLSQYPAATCAAAGVLGALVSVLQRLTKRLPDGTIVVSVTALAAGAVLRLLAGGVFAFAVYVLIRGGLVPVSPTTTDETAFYAAIGFLAGFSERLIGDIVLEYDRASEGAAPAGSPERAKAVGSALPSLVMEGMPEALVPWSGWISVALDDEKASEGERGWRLHPDRRYVVDIVFSPEETGRGHEVKTDIRGAGAEAPVTFSVRIDEDDGQVSADPAEVKVAPGVPASASVAMHTGEEATGESKLWFHIIQSGTTVKVFDVDVDFGDG